MSKIISDSPTLKGEKGSSRPQGTAVGSGSRPTSSKVKIPTSAPSSPHELSRAPGGWLK